MPDPRWSRRHSPAFPDITLADIVRAQRLMLDSLGVRHLVAVAGQSFGGFQAFQWAISYPDFLDGIVATVTAPRGLGGEASVTALLARLAADPGWHDGWHYRGGGMRDTMTTLRMETLDRYGTCEILAATVPDPADRESRLREMAERWAREFDPNSLVTLRKAMVRFDASARRVPRWSRRHSGEARGLRAGSLRYRPPLRRPGVQQRCLDVCGRGKHGVEVCGGGSRPSVGVRPDAAGVRGLCHPSESRLRVHE
jgi:homoserine acetyltransferase